MFVDGSHLHPELSSRWDGIVCHDTRWIFPIRRRKWSLPTLCRKCFSSLLLLCAINRPAMPCGLHPTSPAEWNFERKRVGGGVRDRQGRRGGNDEGKEKGPAYLTIFPFCYAWGNSRPDRIQSLDFRFTLTVQIQKSTTDIFNKISIADSAFTLLLPCLYFLSTISTYFDLGPELHENVFWKLMVFQYLLWRINIKKNQVFTIICWNFPSKLCCQIRNKEVSNRYFKIIVFW